MQELLDLDARLSERVRIAERPGPLRTLMALLAHSGDSWFWALGLVLFYIFGPQHWRGLAVLMGLGIVVTAALVMLVKFTVRRRRPEGEWGKFYRWTDPHSFPSGHAARAMMLAVLAIGVGPAWFGILMLVWAFLVSFARVAMGVHYLSDVLAGLAAGAIMGWLYLAFWPDLQSWML